MLMPCDEMREAEQMAERLSEAVRQPIDIGEVATPPGDPCAPSSAPVLADAKD